MVDLLFGDANYHMALNAKHPFDPLVKHPRPSHHRRRQAGKIDRVSELLAGATHRATDRPSTAKTCSRRRRTSMYRRAMVAKEGAFTDFFCRLGF